MKKQIYKIWSTKLGKFVNIEAPNMYTALEQARMIEDGAKVVEKEKK